MVVFDVENNVFKRLTTTDLLQVASLSPLSRLVSSLFQVPDRDQMMVRSLTV